MSPAVCLAIRSQVDVLGERLAARVHAEDRLAAREIGRRDEHLPVEAARPEQRRVEILEPVRRAHDDDPIGRLEAVELDEELVERLILLAVEAVAAARGADRVELVDEDDRRRVLRRLFEELADARGAEPGEHLHEGRRRSANRSSRRTPRDGLRHQRLAGSRRAVQEDPLRDARAESLEALRLAQEVDELGELLLDLVEAGDVVERTDAARWSRRQSA